MSLATKFSRLAYKRLIASDLPGKLLDEAFPYLQEWRLFYEIEGGPGVREPRRREHPWRPWAEAMIKWACTPPFQEKVGPYLMSELCEAVAKEVYDGIQARLSRDVWNRYKAEIPDFLMTEEFIIKHASLIHPRDLFERFQTEKVVSRLAAHNPDYLTAYPQMITEETAFAICRRNGERFGLMPDHLQTGELLDCAMENCCYVFDRAPAELQTQERAIRQVERHKSLSGIPQELITQEMANEAISYSLYNIEYVNRSMITPESAFEGSVQDPGKVARFVPEDMINDDFIRRLVMRNSRAFYDLPQQWIPPSLVVEAISRNVMTYKSLRSHQKTDEIADLMISKRPEAFALLDSGQRTLERARAVVDQFPYAIQLVDLNAVSDEDLLRAVKADYKVMVLLPPERRTHEMEREALIQNGELLKMINKDLRTEEVCLLALTHETDLAWRYVPKHLASDPSFRAKAGVDIKGRKISVEATSGLTL